MSKKVNVQFEDGAMSRDKLIRALEELLHIVKFNMDIDTFEITKICTVKILDPKRGKDDLPPTLGIAIKEEPTIIKDIWGGPKPEKRK